jgi:hypothetical protein
MTRLFTDGAEMQDVVFWDTMTNAVTVASATPAISPYYYYLGNSVVCGKTFTATDECYFRERVRCDIPNTLIRIPTFRTGTTDMVWLSINGAAQFIAQATTIGVLETSAKVMAANTWYLIEIYFKLANAPNGRFVVYVDANKIIDYTGDTLPAAIVTFDNIELSKAAASVLLLDDLALNNITGPPDNSYCGDGVVVKVEPDGNGTHNNWHGSDADDVDNYQMCHEFPKDDDTTYVYHDNTSGVQQQFAMSHLSFTGYTILRIWAEARARKTAAAAMTLKLGQLAAGGADVVSAGRTLYVGSYTKIVGDDSFVNPVDVNPWEEADIDAIEFVAQVT